MKVKHVKDIYTPVPVFVIDIVVRWSNILQIWK